MITRPLRRHASRCACSECRADRSLNLRSLCGANQHLRRTSTRAPATASYQRELHGEQFVKRKTTERRVALIKLVRPVRLLYCARERHEPVPRADLLRERIGQRSPEAIKQLAYRAAEAQRRHPFGEAVDRHDAPRVHRFATFYRAELWRLKLYPPAECLHATGGDDLKVRSETALNESASVPDRINSTALVGEGCDRALHPTSPGLLHAQVNHARANCCRGSSGEFSYWRDRTTVFVSTWQIEEQFSDAGDT